MTRSLMSKCVYGLVIAMAASCGEVKNGDQPCPEGEICACTAGEFIACEGDAAVFCNSSGDGVESQTCGDVGCNTETASCNACVVDTITCSADSTTLLRCGDGGTFEPSEVCGAGCVAGTSEADPDHCGHISPQWLPDVCDELATTPQTTLTGTLDTSMDANCTSVVAVDGTDFCIVRAGAINIVDLKVVGSRVIAFVADDQLVVSGTLDISADGATGGPGTNSVFAGAGVTSLNSSFRGAGGAGFVQAGGAGGGDENGGAGQAGGAITNRLTQTRFLAGARGGNSICGNGQIACLNSIDFSGGGGGGGANLIACRGQLTVSGMIDAGGGGGSGGGDHSNLSTAIAQGGGGGGGSGGYVVLQGAQVVISGKLYANGGGGGGACGTDNCRGPNGADAQRSRSGALGGDTAGNTCGGGIGGSATNVPGPGERTFASAAAGGGGGGGSVGEFQIYTPAGVTPTITPLETSPDPAPSLTVPVK